MPRPRLEPLTPRETLEALFPSNSVREALRDSIKQFGFLFPIHVSPTGRMIDGALRVSVCEEYGIPYEKKVWAVGKESTLASVIADVDNGKALKELDLTEHVAYLLGLGYSVPIIAAALGTGIEHTLTIVDLLKAAPTEPTEEPMTRPADHEVLRYIPEIGAARYEALKTDMRDNGQRDAIRLDSDGYLVDGRARWNICQELGITPVTTVDNSNGWEFGLAANAARLREDYTTPQRLVIAAKLPAKMGGFADDDRRPPSADFVCSNLEITYGSVKPLRQVHGMPNTGCLLEAVADGRIPPATARRIAKTMKPDQFEAAIARIVYAKAVGDRIYLPEMDDEKAARAKKGPVRSTQDRNRNRFIATPHIVTARDNLLALDTVVNGTTELDPAIDGEQATALLRDLLAHRPALNRLIALLKERKETTSS